MPNAHEAYKEYPKEAFEPFAPPASETLFLIRGDLSGIQKYIYGITSKQASKALKGRSFYVQLLVEGLLRYVLHALDLTHKNVVHTSGGGFLIAAPHTEVLEEDLKGLHKEINQALFDTHGTQLFLALDGISYKEGTDELSETLKILNTEKIETQKRQKFRDLAEGFEELFTPRDVGGTTLRDAATGEEIKERKKAWFRKEGSDEWDWQRANEPAKEGVDYFSKITKTQIELGKKLRQAKGVIFEVGKSDNTPDLDLLGLGVQITVVSDLSKPMSDFSQKSELVIWNDPEFKENAPDDFLGSVQLGFYGGNDIPRILLQDKKGLIRPHLKTFSELAGKGFKERRKSYKNAQGKEVRPSHFYTEEFEEEEKKTSFSRLAVLRMDVDNLGSIFHDLKSLKDYHQLSRQLDFFFAGYLNQIWEENFKNHSQIIYAGGDDLFIVGRWDVLIDFAARIRTQFTTFTKEILKREAIGLSGGIALGGAKHPIIRLAEQAGEAEKDAKNHEIKLNGEDVKKNAFTLFGVPLNWSGERSEWGLVERFKDDLLQMLPSATNNETTKALLRYIRNYYEIAQRGESEAWRWRLTYSFARYSEKLKKQQQEQKLAFVAQVKLAILNQKYQSVFASEKYKWEGQEIDVEGDHSDLHFFKLLSVSARWAELLERSNVKPQNQD